MSPKILSSLKKIILYFLSVVTVYLKLVQLHLFPRIVKEVFSETGAE